MADRGKEPTEGTGAGVTQDWVPAELRESAIGRGTQAAGDGPTGEDWPQPADVDDDGDPTGVGNPWAADDPGPETTGGLPAAEVRQEPVESLRERFERLERRFEAESTTARDVVDTLAENLGTRSGEVSRRLVEIERQIAEVALEIEASGALAEVVRREFSAELQLFVTKTEGRLRELSEAAGGANDEMDERLADHRTASLQQTSEANDRLAQLAEGVGRSNARMEKEISRLDADLRESRKQSEAQLAALENRVAEAVGEREDRLGAIELVQDEFGLALERTKADHAERERARFAELQRMVDEMTAGWDEKLERARESITRKVAETVAVTAPAPLPAVSRPPRGFPDGSVVAISPRGPLDINEVRFEELRELGLSVTQTSRLLDFRTARGRITSIDEFDSLPGFPVDVRERIKSQLKVEP